MRCVPLTIVGFKQTTEMFHSIMNGDNLNQNNTIINQLARFYRVMSIETDLFIKGNVGQQ
jgi:hypothetical protein